MGGRRGGRGEAEKKRKNQFDYLS